MYIYLISELIIHKSHKLVDNITEEAVLDSSQWSSAKLKGIFLKLYFKKNKLPRSQKADCRHGEKYILIYRIKSEQPAMLCRCFIMQQQQRKKRRLWMQSSVLINRMPQVCCAHSFISFNYQSKLAQKPKCQLKQLILNQHCESGCDIHWSH